MRDEEAADNVAGDRDPRLQKADRRQSKGWEDLSIEEKIERTREQVHSLRSEMRYLCGEISESQRQVGRLNMHSHDVTGKPVVAICDEPKGWNGGQTRAGRVEHDLNYF
jgi:predicted RNase H-like nuclease (RuvC/YqgF family)